jgi:hypothetical protein
MRLWFGLMLAAATMSGVIAASGAEEPIGKAQAVNPSVNAGLEQERRLVGAGGDIFFGETITSDPTGVLRVVFDDRSKLELGPDSSIIVDEFVYAKKKSAQKLALQLVKGVFRFTSGEMAKEAYSLDTGKVQLGVRGTKFTVLADGLGSVSVTVERGAVEMRAGGRSLLVEAGETGGYDAETGDLGAEDAADLGALDAAIDAMDASFEGADVDESIDVTDADGAKGNSKANNAKGKAANSDDDDDDEEADDGTDGDADGDADGGDGEGEGGGGEGGG